MTPTGFLWRTAHKSLRSVTTEKKNGQCGPKQSSSPPLSWFEYVCSTMHESFTCKEKKNMGSRFPQYSFFPIGMQDLFFNLLYSIAGSQTSHAVVWQQHHMRFSAAQGRLFKSQFYKVPLFFPSFHFLSSDTDASRWPHTELTLEQLNGTIYRHF